MTGLQLFMISKLNLKILNLSINFFIGKIQRYALQDL